MSTTKLTIVPVTLDPITDNSSSTTSPQNSHEPSCILKQLVLKFPSLMA
jgi:hypothetical protein